MSPPTTHGDIPASKPELMTTEADADGVTAFDAAEAAPAPVGLEAVTVKV